jgi:hypothetical protein
MFIVSDQTRFSAVRRPETRLDWLLSSLPPAPPKAPGGKVNLGYKPVAPHTTVATFIHAGVA